MYTVIRFVGASELQEELLAVGAQMNVVQPGVYEGPRARGDGFACDVSSDASWIEHESAIIRFLRDFATSVERAIALGARVEIDTAIEPQDRKDLCLSIAMSHVFLGTVAATKASFEISIYEGE